VGVDVLREETSLGTGDSELPLRTTAIQLHAQEVRANMARAKARLQPLPLPEGASGSCRVGGRAVRTELENDGRWVGEQVPIAVELRRREGGGGGEEGGGLRLGAALASLTHSSCSASITRKLSSAGSYTEGKVVRYCASKRSTREAQSESHEGAHLLE
jgi:hypothetical protein